MAYKYPNQGRLFTHCMFIIIILIFYITVSILYKLNLFLYQKLVNTFIDNIIKIYAIKINNKIIRKKINLKFFSFILLIELKD